MRRGVALVFIGLIMRKRRHMDYQDEVPPFPAKVRLKCITVDRCHFASC